MGPKYSSFGTFGFGFNFDRLVSSGVRTASPSDAFLLRPQQNVHVNEPSYLSISRSGRSGAAAGRCVVVSEAAMLRRAVVCLHRTVEQRT